MLFHFFEKEMFFLFPFLKNEKMTEKLSVVLACSGGVDSIALLFLLWNFEKKYPHLLSLHVSHFNHQLRKESFLEEETLRSFCEQRKISFSSQKAEERKKQLHFKMQSKMEKTQEELFSFSEEVARDLRYAFLEEEREKRNAYLFLAHHQEDQAETLLLHLQRGSGLHGLCGMQKKDGKKVRPLLRFHKKDLMQYLKENHWDVHVHEDASNENIDFERNYVRKKVIPLLAHQESLEKWSEKYFSLSMDMQKIKKIIEKSAQISFNEKQIFCSEKGLIFQRNLEEEESIFLPFFLQKWGEMYLKKSFLSDISRGYYQQLAEAFRSQEAKKIVFEKEYFFFFEFDKMYLSKKEDLASLQNQGKFFLSEGNSKENIEFQINRIEKKVEIRYNNMRYVYSVPLHWLDKKEIDLQIRNLQSQDKIWYKNKEQSLKKYFEEQKIPKSLRQNILFLAKGNLLFPLKRNEN